MRLSSRSESPRSFARIAAFCMLAIVAMPAMAGAQSTADPEVEAILREAITLRQAGRDLESLPRFEAAYARAHSPITAAQLGLVEQALGRWVSAEPHLREALEARTDPWIARNRPLLERAYASNQQHVGRLELLGGIPGAEVRVDGQLVGRLPITAPIPTASGTITLEIAAAGYYPRTRRLEIHAGSLTREFVELEPMSSAAPEPSPSPPPASSPAPSAASSPPETPPLASSSPPPSRAELHVAHTDVNASNRHAREPWRTPVGWAGIAAGLAFGGAGAAFTYWHEDTAFTFNGTCERMTWPSVARCRGLYADATAAQVLAVTSFVVSGVAIVGGVVALLWPDRHERSRAVNCVPDGLLGASCAIRF